MPAIKNNKGKVAVVIIYLLIVFVAPLVDFTPIVQDRVSHIAQSIVPANIDTFFRQYIGFLQEGKLSSANKLLVQEGGGTVSTSSNEEAISAYLASTTDQMQVVGAHWYTTFGSGNSVTTYDVVYQIPNNDRVYKYVLVEIVAQSSGTTTQIVSLNTGEATHSVETFQFDFATDIIPLLLSILLPLFIAYTALRYITKAQKPHWVLLLVILLVAIYASVVSDNVGINFGVYGFISPPNLSGQLGFAFPLPLGAIYYWIRRKHYDGIRISQIN